MFFSLLTVVAIKTFGSKDIKVWLAHDCVRVGFTVMETTVA
jgi:hypothetical protein